MANVTVRDISSIDAIMEQCHRTAYEKGFWDDEKGDYNPLSHNVGEKIALMHSELSEALESLRKDPSKPDSHCPEYTNVEIELADTVIRIFDFARACNMRLSGALLAKMEYNQSRGYKHGKSF